MTTTIHLPTGTKVRTATRRRYVVLYERPETHGAPIRAHVEYRTDDLARAKAYRAKHGRHFRFIADTVSAEVTVDAGYLPG